MSQTVAVFLALLYHLAPLVCWALMARTAVVGAAVGVLLASCAVFVTGVDQRWFATRAGAEINVCFVPVVCLVITAGVLVERRLRGPRPKRTPGDRVGRARIALGVCLGLFGLLGTPVYLLLLRETLLPSTSEVLPLPPGLTLLSEDDGSTGDPCGSGTCSSGVEVGSSTGLSGEEIARRLRASLTDGRGWHLDAAGAGCRRNGWLLDRRQLCVSLWPHDHSVSVLLEGGDRYHDDVQ